MIDRMTERSAPDRAPGGAGPSTRRLRVGAAAVAALLLVSSCGSSNDEANDVAIDVAIDGAPTTVRPSTTLERSTTSPTTTTGTDAEATATTLGRRSVVPTVPRRSTTTTERPRITTSLPESTLPSADIESAAPIPTGQQETQPIAPPVDAYASEPVIEMGRIVIPKLGVDMAMYEGIRMTTLDYGPGHWPGTALPGQAGNVVVGGHRTSKHAIFRNVHQLVAGDQIIYRDDRGEHVYIVNRVEIVQPDAVWIVDPTPTPTTTLFACHPPGSTAQRIIVFADLAGG